VTAATGAALAPATATIPALTVGVLREPGDERRVALTPDSVPRLTALGLEVMVQAGAGEAAWFPDAAYVAAGAAIRDTPASVLLGSDVLACIRPPNPAALHPGQILIGLLNPLADRTLVVALAAAQVTALSLDGLPRTLSNAQSMDALTSQANVAGYKAALVAAAAYGGYFPMLITAAGTVRPAKVLVIGAGVAGLQAIGTTRRLGALVTGYDVREAARGDVASTGASFLDLSQASTTAGTGAGGYARELTADEQSAQQEALVRAIATFDVVITTAQVPGRRPPILVSAAAIAVMAPGSVIVDTAASPLGGNVVGSAPNTTTVTPGGVTIIGAGDLPATVPRAASSAYARNVAALLAHLVAAGRVRIDQSDPVTAGILLTRDGEVVRADLQPTSIQLTAAPTLRLAASAVGASE
jgi:NAD(P) transhydrogenase subunit alpha